ncbi:hypothetical protein K437DRAFT_71174 [Tilletiaria anomala UBC 951]|uniref:Uncharacterized protein n=1 Tax=Tilletiaria anomala (strain ATCC 24038 / CBS 436.72 / UBC 951) TaxID=1037660 RepID=A0A066WHG2_TILAU|nr:uncharacterized protein K437DRAFT_71174 [Tilletiaria anomala UBC 951]KDN53422.1 hypothetical protein K437DRAFT_71174 [Tilletiaria anomala UBC 951]
MIFPTATPPYHLLIHLRRRLGMTSRSCTSAGRLFVLAVVAVLSLSVSASFTSPSRLSPSPNKDLHALLARQATNATSTSVTRTSSASASPASASSPAASSNSSSGTGGPSCSMTAPSDDPNQSTSWSSAFVSTCCVQGKGAICYTRTSTSSSSCAIPSCSDLASGNSTQMNGFVPLAPAATADNPDPMGNGAAGSGRNLTYSNYAPDGAGGNAERRSHEVAHTKFVALGAALFMIVGTCLL